MKDEEMSMKAKKMDILINEYSNSSTGDGMCPVNIKYNN